MNRTSRKTFNYGPLFSNLPATNRYLEQALPINTEYSRYAQDDVKLSLFCLALIDIALDGMQRR